MEENIIDKIEWSAPEYKHKKKSMDFLWAIGLFAIIFFGAAIWFGNYIFAIFIFISGVSLIFFSIREPENINFIIDNNGLTMGKDTHEWKNIRGFNIKKNSDSTILLIELNKYLLPVYTIPLPNEFVSNVRESLLKFIPLKELDESKSMMFVEKLGF